MPPPAGAVWPIGFRREQRCACSASADDTSGLGAPLRTRDADAGARDVGAAGRDLALLDQLVEHRRVSRR